MSFNDMQCDFCGMRNPPVQVRYRCESFETIHGIARSSGDWLACLTCSTLIEMEQWTKLAERSLDMFPEHIWQDPRTRRGTIVFVLNLHQQFRTHRIGPCERVENGPN